MTIDDKLFKVKYVSDEKSHLCPSKEDCKTCKEKSCTYICPANVYEWSEELCELVVNYENCLECGACRIACECNSLEWHYPKGNKGVTFKYG